MTDQQIMEIEARYTERFGSLEDLAIFELATQTRFWELVQSALDRGQPLTEQEVRATFPGTSWNE